MNDAATVGVAAGVFGSVLSAWVALRQSRAAAGLAQLKSDLDEEVGRRSELFKRELDAEDLLTRYRQPLAAAAFDLQSRLYNILHLDFFKKFADDSKRSEEALTTTLFRLAQYLGWTEILRRDVQFLSFPEEHETMRVADLQWKISSTLLDHSYGRDLMIWSDEQRAIGELMIVEKPDKLLCMGYAAFRDQCGEEHVFHPWRERLRAEIQQEPARARMHALQHLLCELVEALDPKQLRYRKEHYQLAP